MSSDDPYDGAEPSTLPPPSRVPRTDPKELARRERIAKRTVTRSRIAELVALVTIIAGAVQAYYSHQPHPQPAPRPCTEVRP